MTIPATPNEKSRAYWSQTPAELARTLETTLSGLTNQTAAERLARFGRNSLETRKQTTPIGLFLNQFKSPIVLILLFATIVSAFVQDWTDSAIILAIVVTSALLSFIQENQASSAAEKLKAQVTAKARVWRDGREITLPSAEVVPGDIVLLSAGSLIPGDGVVLEAKDFFVNQAVMTGETFPVEKTPGVVAESAALINRTNCVFMGTNVSSGSARVLIVDTGMRTAFGQITKRLTLHPPETEFERGIRKLGYLLTEVMSILVLVIFALNVFYQKPVLDSLLFSIALAVGLTPQLLPAIININLSRGSQKMAARGVIVRRLAAIENFGSMDILCTDKTGTLTLGVVNLDYAYDAEGKESTAVRRAAWLNAHFQTGMVNVLDEAVLASIKESEQSAVKVDEIPYDFTRKRLSVIVNENGDRTMISKGALENILAICSKVEITGVVEPLTGERLEILRAHFAEWSELGYRVLGVATKEIEEKQVYHLADEADLTFRGFLLFMDPPKPDVKETIDSLSKLGVQLKIITGDNKLVARHTAEMIGIPTPKILTGAELDVLRDEALWQAAEHTDIFAEVDPNEKERIILALKKTGHVVGYMGDGINDAPSLHSADVGISVDNAVDVAKEAAEFVLLKHDLAVLLDGIMEGRKTFANTLKYVFMAVSANFGNMFSMAGASLFLSFIPMLPKQILLINFLTDFPEMTIAGDNVDEIFIQQPHKWDVAYIRRFMLVFGPLSSVFDFLTFGLLIWVLHAGEAQFHTGWFIESIMSAALVVFAVRTRLPFQHSRPSRVMLLATLAVIVFTLLLPYSPLAGIFELTPLPISNLLALTGIVALYFTCAEVTKRWFFKRFG